jgi:hypothetical protein
MNDARVSAGEVVLETDRLLLRRWRVSDAALQRELWTERDLRVPPHRRLWATVRDWNTASRRVMTKLGSIETARVDADDTYGNSLFYTKNLLSMPGDEITL